MINTYLQDCETTTTLIVGVTLGVALCCLWSPMYTTIKNWWSSPKTKLTENISDKKDIIENTITEEAATLSEKTATLSEVENTITEEAVTISDETATVSDEENTITEEAATLSEETATVSEKAATLSEQEITLSDELSESITNGLQITNNLFDNQEILLTINFNEVLRGLDLKEQIEFMTCILPFLENVDKATCEALKTWCEANRSDTLEPSLILYMTDILEHLETLMSFL